MKYCIGEFSSLLGISKDTLRLYEKHNIVKPVKDRNNRYRYFNDLDARDLLMSRWYRSLRIPLQEVAGLVKDSSLGGIMEKIQDSKLNLEEEIRKSTMLLNKIEELNEEIQELETSLYRCDVRRIPGLYRIKQTNKDSLLKHEGLEGTVNAWMDMLPYTFYCFRIENEDVLAPDANILDYSWGLTLTDDDVRRLGVEIGGHAEYIAPCICVSAAVMSPYGGYFTRDSLQFMFDYIRDHHYSLSGHITGKLILTENAGGRKRSYLRVNIPIDSQ